MLYVTPDSLSAERRFLFAEPMLRAVGISAKILHERPSKSEEELFKRNFSGIIFGPLSLLKQSAPWKRVGLVVSEEDVAVSDSLGKTSPCSVSAKSSSSFAHQHSNSLPCSLNTVLEFQFRS